MPAMTLKEKAYLQLKRMILHGELKRGDDLTERTLVDLLQMSRTPIRSALEKLESEGLVTYTPNKGILIAEISLEQAVDFYDFRVILESHVVRSLAVRGFLEEQTAWLQANLQEQAACVETKNYSDFTVLDTQFHLYLAKCYGNSEVVNTMESLQDKLFQIAIRVLRKDSERIRVSYADHVAIVRFIAESQTAEAERQMAQHLEFGKRILVL